MRNFLILLVIGVPLLAREANTTLNFPSELSSAFQFKDFLNGMVFTRPVCLRTPAGATSLYVVEKGGRIYLINNVNNPQKQLFLDISSKVDSGGESGLLSIAFHPNFSSNKTFFLFYTSPYNGSRHQFVSRFVIQSESSNPNTPYSFTETVLIRQQDQASNHNGGDMHFGQDGYLYISVGDEGNQNDSLNNSQRIDKDFFSAIIRIDVDRKSGNLEPNDHSAVVKNGGVANYKVPSDNPWVGATSFNGSSVNANNVRTEFYAVGFRNPWRMSFDPAGNLWIGDVGQGSREEIDFVPIGQKGMNFGWNFREGFISGPRSAPAGVNPDDPIHDYDHGSSNFSGKSVTGGVYYSGDQIPSLKNKYIFGDYVSGNVWHLTKSGSSAQVGYITNEKSISAFGHNPETGEVLICKYDTGKILKLVEGTGNENEIPTTLSATGAFSDTAALTPEAGVVPYEPNVTFWSDYAIKSRWFSLPQLNQKFGFKTEGPWTYPAGTVWVKHFDLEMERGNPTSKVRVETRFLVKTQGGAYGLSYRWNNAGTEATLVPPEGENIYYNIRINGVSTPKTWTIPSRSACLECHTPNGGFALSFNTRQLNRTYNSFGSNENIISALHSQGYLDVNPGSPASLPKHFAANDSSATLEQKARSYLDVNCAYCHQEGGPTPAEFDARALLTNIQTGLINGVPLNNGGDSTRRLILPGNSNKSVVLSRISESNGFTRMPPIATTELDHGGMALIQNWINELGNNPAPEYPFQPDTNGMVVIEAENKDTLSSGTNNHDWIALTESGASGGTAYISSPDVGVNQNTGYVGVSPRLDYKVNFDRAGTFTVWVRGKAIAGKAGTSDSVHVGLNGSESSTSDKITGFSDGYGWSKNTMDGAQATINIPSPGEHRVNVWMREDGFTFDKLILTPVESFTPSGNGPQESSRAPSSVIRKVTVSIDPYNSNNWDFFQAKVKNDSTVASVKSIHIKSLGSGNIDIFENGSKFTVTPDLGGNNDSINATEVTLNFSGNGLAPGDSDENGFNNNRSDVDGSVTGYEVTVTFTDGGQLSGSMTNSGDTDDGDSEFWTVTLESANDSGDVFYGSYQLADIGNSSFSLSEANGQFTMTAAGTDIWGSSDEFGFAYMEWTGDVTLVAKVNSLNHVHDWSKTGIMIRASLNGNSRHASMFATHNRVSAHWRINDGGSSTPDNIQNSETKPPVWVKLIREGNVFRAFYSFDGGTWYPNGTRTINMPEKVYIGIALTSHLSGTTASSVISNVEVKKPDSEIFVRRLVLTNADTKTDIRELNDWVTINRAALGTNNFNIRAELSENPGSVEFNLNDALRRYEHFNPYYFNGDDGNWLPAPGNYVIDATPSSEQQGNGVKGETLKVRITVE